MGCHKQQSKAFLEIKQRSQATTIKNPRSETGWEFAVLLIKDTECSI